MATTNQLLDVLKQIGLNLYERRLWLALLSRGNSTAGELSKISKVPHSRTYDILQSLADRGFILIQPGRPLRYVALKPSEAFERAKKKISEDAELAKERIANLQKSPILKDLEQIYKNSLKVTEPAQLSGVLHGRHAFHRQFGTLLDGAKRHVSIVGNASFLKEIAEKHGETIKRAARNGVKIRIVAPPNAELDNDLGSVVDLKTSSKSTEMRLALIDDNHVMFALTNDKETHPTQDITMWAQSGHASSKLFMPMFERIWNED